MLVLLLGWAGGNVVVAADPWWKVEADAVTIYTDSSAKQAQLFAQDYDAMMTVTEAFLGREGYASPRPIVVLFRRERDLDKVFGTTQVEVDEEILQRSLSIDGRQVIAMTTAQTDESYLPANPSVIAAYGRALPWWVAQGTHLVLNQRFNATDLDYRGLDRKDFPERWTDDEVTPWDVFFSARGRPEMMAEEEDRTAAQARAWGLMSWLMEGGDGPARVQRFLALLQEKTAEAALVEVAGMSLEELKVPVLRSVRNRKHREEFRDWYSRRKSMNDYEAVPLPEVERLALWSDAAAANGRDREARRAFEQAEKQAADALPVIELAARRAFKAGDLAGAYAHYLEAVQRGTDNAWAHLSVASWQLQQLSAGQAFALEDIRDHTMKAIMLNPGMAEAFGVLGTIGLVTPQRDPAIMQALDDRVGPDATGTQALLYRAALRARAGDVAAGLADLERIFAEPEAPRNTRLSALQQWGALAMPELQATVKQALAAGDVAAALAAVDAALAGETRSLAIDAGKLLRAQIEQMAAQR